MTLQPKSEAPLGRSVGADSCAGLASAKRPFPFDILAPSDCGNPTKNFRRSYVNHGLSHVTPRHTYVDNIVLHQGAGGIERRTDSSKYLSCT